MIQFIVDESTGPGVSKWLKAQNWVVFSVFNDARGWADAAILEKANREKWVILTNDKDFGDLIFRDQLPHHGVILLRLKDETTANKISIIAEILRQLKVTQIENHFIVATEKSIRVVTKK